jgi:hypothetical protein
VPKIKDVIGHALEKIGTYSDLDNKEHVVALIDEVIFTKSLYQNEVVYFYSKLF